MHTFEVDLGGRKITLETGKMAKQANGAVVVQNVISGKSKTYGFNAATGTYEDLVKAGVIDPTKVVRSGLQNAASVASLLLTTDALVSEIPEKEKKEPAGHGHAH